MCHNINPLSTVLRGTQLSLLLWKVNTQKVDNVFRVSLFLAKETEQDKLMEII